MSNTFKWYAIYCMPRWEKKVADLLTKKSIITYCPLNKVQRQWSDRKKIVEEPLFKSYVFVQLKEDQKLIVRETNGVVNFVYWLGKPAEIRAEEIEIIKKFLNDYHDVHVEKAEVVVDDKVKVLSGPFMNYEGSVMEVNNHTVKVHIPSLGYALVAKLDRKAVQIVYPQGEMLKVAK